MIEQSHSKLSISYKPPLPNIRILPSPRSPGIPTSPSHKHIIRRTSNSKSIQRSSVEKSQRQKEIQNEIKYAKSPKQEGKSEVSFIESENTFAGSFNHRLEDSQQTIQRVTTYSREKREGVSRKKQSSTERLNAKMFDSLSGVSHSNTRRGGAEKNQEYYLYWKNKAHEYLESNIKFMQQINRLTRENEELKETIQRLQLKEKEADRNEAGNLQEKEITFNVRSMSLHYLKKLQEMQKELKRKEIIIQTYEINIKELKQSVVGDKERIKLISSMRGQINQLKLQNHNLSNEIKLLTLTNTSTSFKSIVHDKSKKINN